MILLLLCCQIGIAQSQSKSVRKLDLNEFTALCAGEKDKITIVNFWATWCGPCMEELPYFKKLKAELPSVRVILVNLDFEKDYEKKLLPIIAKKQYEQCEIYRLNKLSPDDWMPVVDASWSGAIPGTLILDGGKKKFIEQKFESYTDLKTAILQF